MQLNSESLPQMVTELGNLLKADNIDVKFDPPGQFSIGTRRYYLEQTQHYGFRLKTLVEDEWLVVPESNRLDIAIQALNGKSKWDNLVLTLSELLYMRHSKGNGVIALLQESLPGYLTYNSNGKCDVNFYIELNSNGVRHFLGEYEWDSLIQQSRENTLIQGLQHSAEKAVQREQLYDSLADYLADLGYETERNSEGLVVEMLTTIYPTEDLKEFRCVMLKQDEEEYVLTGDRMTSIVKFYTILNTLTPKLVREKAKAQKTTLNIMPNPLELSSEIELD